MTSLRDRLRKAGQGDAPLLTGPFLAVPSPMVVEIACGAQPDFVCVDMEHGPISAETGENMVRAAAVHGIPALVRVPGPDGAAIGQVLDWGAAGILVPRIDSARDAARAVDAARYPPEGTRGAGPGRASGYGRRIPQTLEHAAAETVVALQVETVAGVENLAEILKVPGVDLIFIGPGDLGVGLRAAGRDGTLEETIDHILAACAAAQMPAGLFVMTRADHAAYAGRLALAIVGSDATLLVAGFDAQFS